MAEYTGHIWDRGLRALLDGDRATSVAMLRRSVEQGHRDWQDLEDPMLHALEEDAGFIEVIALLESELASERDKALVMMCRENPVPESWQPLAETCADTLEPLALDQR